MNETINLTVARLIGIFEGTKATVGADYYLDKFTQTILSDTDTIVFDEVINDLVELEVVPRGTKGTTVKVNGFGRASVTPDIISGASPVTPNELLALQVGGKALINGEEVNKQDQIDLRHMQRLRRGYENTRRSLAYQVYLSGKMTLKSGEELDFGLTKVKDINFDSSKDSWYTYLAELSDQFFAENGVYPNSIEVTKSLFDKIATSKGVLDAADKVLKVNLYMENGIRKLEMGGLTITSLPISKTVDLGGPDITKDDLIFLSNNEAFVKGYAALVKSEGNNLGVISAEVLVGEETKAYPAQKMYYLESAFMPIVPLKNSIARFKVKIK